MTYLVLLLNLSFAAMLLAEKKKQENIAEYIIYMYQTELLLRNFDLDIEKLKVHVFGNISEEKMPRVQKEEYVVWYRSVIEDMRREELEKEGHLSYVQEEVDKLSNLSIELLSKNTEYKAIFNAARRAIRQNIEASDGLVSNPIQICLNGVFGMLLARMNGKEVPEEVQSQLEHFGNVLSFLSVENRKENIGKKG